MYAAFGVFIVTCGITHFFDVVTIWYPAYWIDAGVRVVTAVASVGTAVLLVPLVPKAVALAGAAQVAHARGVELEALNRDLAELTERTRREYHRTVAETVPQKVWVATADGVVEYLNRRWTEYTGLDLERVRRDGLTAAIHPDDRARAVEAWEHSLATRAPFEVEYRIRDVRGDYRWHLARALPVIEDGSLLKWVGSATDIDDDRRASEERVRLVAELRAALRTRYEFLSIASHELRTPLTTLGLQVDVLTTMIGNEAPRFLERCAMVKRQVDRLENLVGVLLEVSRLSGGQMQLRLEEVDLGDVARDVVDDARARSSPEQRIALEVERGVVGRWDRLRLMQVVTNLVTNAVKYGQGKPIEVRVRAQDGDALLEVRDEGIGIDAVDQGRIFGRFERAVSEEPYGGFGLGLWISREIVRALSGTIAVESAPRRGSTFTVKLPRGLDDRG